MSIKVIVDSASDISEAQANQMGITMIPLVVTFENEEFYDGVNLLPEQFYEKLAMSDKLPMTSQINSYRWEEIFKETTKNGDEVIAIALSSKLSGTYESARQASEKFNGKVHVIDSLSAAIGERFLVNIALDLIKKGKTAPEIVSELENVKNKIKIYAVVDTLKYLKKGGRISSTVAFAGELLNIKPIVGLVDGEVKMLGKTMGLKKAFAELNKLIAKTNGIDETKPYGLLFSGLDHSNLDKYIASCDNVWPKDPQTIEFHSLGGTIGTHVGPNAVGIAFFEK